MPANVVDLRKVNKGVYISKNGVIVHAEIPHINVSGIRFYDKETCELIFDCVIDESNFKGSIAYICINDSIPEGTYYSLYNDFDEFVDDYATKVVFKDLKAYGVLSCEQKPLSDNKLPHIPFEETVFYQVSVRGATMADPSIKADKGTFKALEKKIPYYKDMGVTSLILMPIYICEPFSMIKKSRYDYRTNTKDVVDKPNFWGFGNSYHFSLKPELAVSGDAFKEFYSFIRNLHKAGLECILMMQFEECRDTAYILEVLNFWVLTANVDGFRLIGNNIDTKAISQSPYLKGVKLIFENFDFNKYKPVNQSKYKNVACLNNDYLNLSRRFLKGDDDCVSAMSYMVRKNSSYCAHICNITDFAGFTLNDLVSYNLKHNEANGEDNTDGTDYNYSWNCGEEGPTNKKAVLKLRRKMSRNAALLYLLSQGTPLIQGGDELLNTQKGNNNPYSQDNEIGWVTYRKDAAAKDYFHFIKNLIAFRKRHCILHQPKELMLFDYMSCKVPDVSFHGQEAFRMDCGPVSKEFGILYYGAYAKQYTNSIEASVYIIYNLNWEKREFALPLKGADTKWKLLYSSDGSTDESFDESTAIPIKSDSYIAESRSISILITE